MASFTNRSLGEAELCFYFLSNPKNSLYQFTFPRLSWQGKVPESYFFLNECLLCMFSFSKQTQPTPCFERSKV